MGCGYYLRGCTGGGGGVSRLAQEVEVGDPWNFCRCSSCISALIAYLVSRLRKRGASDRRLEIVDLLDTF